jgi:hypothetical protein
MLLESKKGDSRGVSMAVELLWISVKRFKEFKTG